MQEAGNAYIACPRHGCCIGRLTDIFLVQQWYRIRWTKERPLRVALDDSAPRVRELRERETLLNRVRLKVEENVASGRVEMVNREIVLGYLADLKSLLGHGSPAERKAFLKSFIQSTEKLDSQVTIRYTLPLPQEQVSTEHPGVRDIDHYGGPELTVGSTIFELSVAL